MNDETKPASAVKVLLDKINCMMGMINSLETRICELEIKANQTPNLLNNLSNVAYTGSYNDLTDVPNIPTRLSDMYGATYAYCTSAGRQTERYVTDMQSQNGDLVIQFSDGTTAHINDEGL